VSFCDDDDVFIFKLFFHFYSFQNSCSSFFVVIIDFHLNEF
jgi:hypothetical protein